MKASSFVWACALCAALVAVDAQGGWRQRQRRPQGNGRPEGNGRPKGEPREKGAQRFGRSDSGEAELPLCRNPEPIAVTTTVSTPRNDQCSCHKPAGSDTCAEYDPALQAGTLEEAVAAFQDPNAPGETIDPANPVIGTIKAAVRAMDADSDEHAEETPVGEEACGHLRGRERTKCEACLVAELRQEKQNSHDPEQQNIIQQIIDEINLPRGIYRQTESLDGRAYRRYCKDVEVPEENSAFNTAVDELISNLGGSTRLQKDNGGILDGLSGLLGRITARRARAKRASEQFIGQSWTINCIGRGERDPQSNDNYVDLCNLCWSWRVLPQQYFPRYINELNCDSDTVCLRGYGQCQQRVRQINVLYNRGSTSNPDYQAVSLPSKTSCDCRVAAGSALHSWISS